jgi:type II secretory pathway component PulF
MLKLPIFGEVIRMVAVSRFASTMATLMNGGVPILSALAIVKSVVDNEILASAVQEAKENITEGLWRVTVKVDEKRIVGRMKFYIKKSDGGEEMVNRRL